LALGDPQAFQAWFWVGVCYQGWTRTGIA
jgi:hypothetical protein